MDIIYLPVIIVTLFVLGYVSYQDMKAREINITNLLFIVLFSIVYLGLFVFKTNLILWKYYAYQIIIVFVFVLIFYLLGRLTKFAYIGEGDLYTIFALSFTNVFSSLFVIFVFLIALLFLLGVPIILFIYNFFKGNYPKYPVFKSIILMFLGFPKKINRLTKFYTPLEEITVKNGTVHKNITFIPNFDPSKDITLLQKKVVGHNIQTVWVSPLVPFILLIFFSYIFIIISVFIFKLPIIMKYISYIA